MKILDPSEYFEKCYDDFGFFFREFVWPSLNGDTYVESEYLTDLLVEYATAFDNCQIRKLLLAIPPRNGKTTLFTIALPLWSWLRNPRLDWISISAADPVIADFYSDRTKLANSDLFRAMWAYRYGERVYNYAADSIKLVENGLGGKLHQWTILNTRIGLGGHRLVIDDPTPPKFATNKLYHAKVEREFKQGTLSRRHDKDLGAESPTLVIQQRIAERDLIGCMRDVPGWEYLEIQAIAEERTTFHFPLSGKSWTREIGNVMNPERESLETLTTLRAESVDGGFQAQYQQRPTNTENAVVSVKEVKLYSKPQEQYSKIILSIDPAATIEKYSSNWGYSIWGVAEDKMMDLLDCHAKKYEYPGGKKKAIELIEDWEPDEVIIEAKSTGLALTPELEKKYKSKIKLISHIPSSAHKDDRIIEAIPRIKNFMRFPDLLKIPGAVWYSLMSYELLSFPNSATDDLLDTCVMAIDRVHPFQKRKTNLRKFYGVK